MSTENQIFSAAERFLAMRMMSQKELEKKLSAKFPEEGEIIQKIIQKCLEYGFLNDEKYAETFLRYERNRSPKSDFFLRRKLFEKGISEEIIDRTLSENPGNEKEMIQKIAEKKVMTFSKILDQKKKEERLIRFLMGRGFSFSSALEAAKKVLKTKE